MTEATATGLVGFEAPIADIKHVSYHYGRVRALDDVSLTIAKGRTIGVIGPDGVGKSSLLSLISGARSVQEGVVTVFGGDMSDRAHRSTFCTDIAYMPQGLGKNLYPTLSVIENIDFFGRLFSYSAAEIDVRANELLERTGLAPFRDRPAGKLSGGMKQKLGLCCALIHDPALLILDEPTTGIDPLSRQQFWELIETFRRARAGMTVLVATAYMEEAARFDSLIAMNAGQVMFQGTPSEMLAATKAANLDTAFIRMLPGHAGEQYQELVIPERSGNLNDEPAIVARHLCKRFGDFVAVNDVSLDISRGEIFGFLGSNGCGKSTTMKMLTGLLPATDGEAELFRQSVNASDKSVRRRIGYMSQSFSLYNELTVRQNLTLHARLFSVSANDIPLRVAEMARRFDLTEEFDALPSALPLGLRQRLSLAVAMIHAPDILILDEPTSGVDPIARDGFWRILVELSRNDNVTIFISTHFMNEAERCDRISLMHAGRVLVSDTPGAIKTSVNCTTLEEAFIRYLQDAQGAPTPSKSVEQDRFKTQVIDQRLHHSFTQARNRVFDMRRMLSYTKREGLELRRDPVRATLAVLGSVILMFVIGYGINMDVEDLSFAVLDLDDTVLSQDYASDIAGSRYFIEKPPIQSYADLDSRMRSGELSLAIEIPPGFGRDLERGDKVSIGAWIDGAMPQRAETVRAYVQGLQAEWLGRKAREIYGPAAAQNAFSIETRFRYNPDIRSLVAMVPAVIPLLLLLIPAMLAALSVVREKELGSITNLYVTPVTRLEFFFGKQIPYVVLGISNFLLLFAFATLIFRVNFTGSFLAYTAAALLYVMIATSIGIVISSLMSSQIAALFATALLTLIPATQYSGLTDPVSSLKGVGALIGRIYPASYFMSISRGTFSKGLSFEDLSNDLLALLITVPAVTLIGIILIKDQER